MNFQRADSSVVVLLENEAGRGVGQTSRSPVWKTMLYTLDISARFLAASLWGRGSDVLADRLIDGYWRRIFRSGNARLTATGREHFVPGQAYVVMSNHASILDIPALMGAIPGSMRMVMKEELKRVPLWGQALVASGFIPVDRKNRAKAIAQLDKAKQNLKKGVSVWVSPEGTRARDGKLAPFKKGGFHVALGLGVPIIPAWIEGTQDIVPPDQFGVRLGGDAQVRFGAPIATEGLGRDDIDGLIARVRAEILALSGRAAEVDGAPASAQPKRRAA